MLPQGVWDWLTDANASAEAGEELSRTGVKIATVRRSRIELPSDYEVMSGFSTLKIDELDEQTRDMLDLIVGDEVTEAELRTLDESTFEDGPEILESEVLSAADETRINNLAAQPVVAYDDEVDATDALAKIPIVSLGY